MARIIHPTHIELSSISKANQQERIYGCLDRSIDQHLREFLHPQTTLQPLEPACVPNARAPCDAVAKATPECYPARGLPYYHITIAMMHHFTRLELTFKKLLGKQPMNAHSFPVTPRSRIRIQRLGHGLFYSNHAEIPDTQNQNSTLER